MKDEPALDKCEAFSNVALDVYIIWEKEFICQKKK